MLSRLFPVDYDAANDRVHQLSLNVESVERSVFLDTRIAADLASATVTPRGLLAPSAVAERVGVLLHTSFCGSTLLAKALHDRECLIALREPLILRRLADAAYGGSAVESALPDLVARLVEPWPNGAAALVKPTHVALPYASMLLDSLPQARVLALTSGLEDFLLSNIRKPEDTRARVGELISRQSHGNPLHLSKVDMLADADFLDAVALQWSLQREWLGVLRRRFPERLHTLDASTFYRQPVETLVAASDWLGVSIDSSAAQARLAPLLGVHAKAPHLSYDVGMREHHNAVVRDAYAQPLQRAIARWEARIAPLMCPEGLHIGSP